MMSLHRDGGEGSVEGRNKCVASGKENEVKVCLQPSCCEQHLWLFALSSLWPVQLAWWLSISACC